MTKKSENIFWQKTKVSKAERQSLNQHKSFILWFTGLSGAGKTSLATAMEQILYGQNKRTYILDGDNIRHGLNQDLGFSDQDRVENIRRVGEVAKLMIDAGVIVLTAFISPFRQDRNIVRSLVSEDEFIEVFVDCPLEVCEERDTKGLYKKARQGEIKNFTGIDSVYEKPQNPDIVVSTADHSLEDCCQKIMSIIKDRQLLIR